MKTLSLCQPWAELVVIGAKRFETRSWATKYRGPLLIHASKRFTKTQQALCFERPFVVPLLGQRLLNRGGIIGCVELVDCQPTEKIAGLPMGEIGLHEIEFGDFSPGRYAWKLTNPLKFDKPIEAKGSLGIWEFPESAY